MLFQILTTTFPGRIGDTGLMQRVCIFSLRTHAITKCVADVAPVGAAAALGGVSWKNTTDPVAINQPSPICHSE